MFDRASKSGRGGLCREVSIVLFVSLLVLHFAVRVVLFWKFELGRAHLIELLKAFTIGWLMDLFVACCVMLPVAAWLALKPSGPKLGGLHRRLSEVMLLGGAAVAVFLGCAEYFFFDEFHSRFNTVAVDYLLYPHEVFVNIWESYPLVWVIAGCLGAAGIWLVTVKRSGLVLGNEGASRRRRFAPGVGALAGVAILWPVATGSWKRFSEDRVLNEIASNGWYSFVQAAVSREFEFAPFYRTMPLEQAYARTRKLIGQRDEQFAGTSNSLVREVTGDAKRPKLNVVILLEESLGSEFFGCLGRKEATCTPKLDALASEGMLFTNIYASGNRTVRGMEAVLCSFPPLPGDSVVARAAGKHIETIAQVLRRDGYDTDFLYAGRGIFDHVRGFMTANGYDTFVEQKDFEKPEFKTIWGVSNEDLYTRALARCRELDAAEKPFLVTTLSVSNHKPFTYPKGRIAEDPEERTRENAVKYTDYALGEFFAAAKRERFWTNTIFVVVADHGARVYGKQTIPMGSYEVPWLVLGPAVVKRPERIGTLGGQVDVAPTLLGMIGRPYRSTFFGRDLFKIDPNDGRSLLHHNRDIGLYRNGELVVFGLQKTVEFFHGDPKQQTLVPQREPSARARQLEEDATAIFTVANDLYLRDAYRVSETPAPASMTEREGSGRRLAAQPGG